MIDTTTGASPITVFVHAHYPDIWQEMSTLLAERLTLPFHLILTSSHPPERLALPQTTALRTVHFLQVENRGRDILPFLRAINEIKDFDIGLKLHTKKSPQREDGAAWRRDALESLLPPAAGDRAIVVAMQVDGRIGLVAPAGFCLSVRPSINMNLPSMQRVMSALGTDLAEGDLDGAFFAAGSLFWFRRSSLAPLADRGLPELFEAETGQLDGTMAHAMERLFPIVARHQGYLSLAVPALAASSPVMSWSELTELARRHADVPSSYFPITMATAPPESTAPALSSRVWSLLTSPYRAFLPERLRCGLRRLMGREIPALPNRSLNS